MVVHATCSSAILLRGFDERLKAAILCNTVLIVILLAYTKGKQLLLLLLFPFGVCPVSLKYIHWL